MGFDGGGGIIAKNGERQQAVFHRICRILGMINFENEKRKQMRHYVNSVNGHGTVD